MSSFNTTSILLVSAVLVIVIVVAAVILVVAARKSAVSNKIMVENMRLQSRYMDNTEEFCQKTIEMIDSIEKSIAEDGLAVRDETYLEKCSEILTYVHGGDSISEALIADKKHVCQEIGIDFMDEIRKLPDSRQIEEIDLVSILGNLLDNAIEGAQASEKESPYVSCSSQIERNVWILQIRNSKNSELNITENNMKTTKMDTKNHGLGTRIIKTAIGKYHGKIKFEDGGNLFIVSVKVILKR